MTRLKVTLRAIIGQMKLTEIVTDRNALADRVQENATRDLEEMGLVIVAFSIQSVSDDRNVISNLGIDNVEQIRKNAAIAKANAERDIISASARAKNEANETQVATDMEIAKRDTDLAKRRAALKAEADTEKAKLTPPTRFRLRFSVATLSAKPLRQTLSSRSRKPWLRSAR